MRMREKFIRNLITRGIISLDFVRSGKKLRIRSPKDASTSI